MHAFTDAAWKSHIVRVQTREQVVQNIQEVMLTRLLSLTLSTHMLKRMYSDWVTDLHALAHLLAYSPPNVRFHIRAGGPTDSSIALP